MSLALYNRHATASMSRERTQDPVDRLKFALDTFPNTFHGIFNLPARARILSELYGALYGSYYSYFLTTRDVPPPGSLLSEAQAKSSLQPADEDGPRACQHVFKKGECCFRCKYGISLLSR
jgi:E3 ubiquitin-protein ligase UBR1